MIHIGAQLYTVRSLLGTEEEMQRTFAKIREIGYTSIQLFGSAAVLEKYAKFAQAAGLRIAGILVDLPTCQACEQALFELCRRYEIPDIGVSTNPTECETPQAYISVLNAFAEKARQAGFSFSYHNHGHEFIRQADGKTAMDHFLAGFNPDAVDFMPDTYWLHDGGCDVRHFLEQTKNRVTILHLKDLRRTPEGHTFAEVGNGNLYFRGILETARACGITQFVVEQDICDGDPLESLRQSYRNIQNLMEDMGWNNCT